MTEANPAVRTHRHHPGYVMVSIPALARAFLDGMGQDVFSSSDSAKAAEERLKWVLHTLPIAPPGQQVNNSMRRGLITERKPRA